MIIVMGFVESAHGVSVVPFVAVIADASVVQTNANLGGDLSMAWPERVYLALITWTTIRFTSMRSYRLSRDTISVSPRAGVLLGRAFACIHSGSISPTLPARGGCPRSTQRSGSSARPRRLQSPRTASLDAACKTWSPSRRATGEVKYSGDIEFDGKPEAGKAHRPGTAIAFAVGCRCSPLEEGLSTYVSCRVEEVLPQSRKSG